MTAAFENVRHAFTGNCDTDFDGKLYTFVQKKANGNIDTATAGGTIMGVAYEEPKKDQPCRVVDGGYAFIMLGGTVAEGDSVSVGADGRAVTTADTAVAVGTCHAGGAAGDIGTVLLK